MWVKSDSSGRELPGLDAKHFLVSLEVGNPKVSLLRRRFVIHVSQSSLSLPV